MIERYESHADYCATDTYQTWLRNWRPPTHTEVEVWEDTIEDIGHDSARIETPRQYGLVRSASRMPFHLLDSMEIGDRDCVDIGCGFNWFKRTYPRMWGVDPHNEPHRDELWTPDWYRVNWGRWSHAWTSNAIHFCHQDSMATNVAKVRGILRPHGTAVITINRARVVDFTPDYDEERLYATLCQTPGMTRMVWFNSPPSAHMDGNVWIWLRQ